MDEEEVVVDLDNSTGVLPVDLSELTGVIDTLNDTIQESMLLDDEESLLQTEEAKTQLEVLNQILEILQKAEEEVPVENTFGEAFDASLLTATDGLSETIGVVGDKVLDGVKDTAMEGAWFVGLSVLIGLAVYLFWNQISKW